MRRAADVKVKVREPLSEDNSLEFYKGQSALNALINVLAISLWVSSQAECIWWRLKWYESMREICWRSTGRCFSALCGE